MTQRYALAAAGRVSDQEVSAQAVSGRIAATTGAADSAAGSALHGVVPPPREALLPCIFLTEEERADAAARLSMLFGGNARPVALHPYAAHPNKTWPAGHWRELARLLDAAGIPWVALGRGTPLFPGYPADLANRTSLRETSALLAASRALVSGDSGPLHMAGAVGTPVVALFGPTTREWGFYPAGSDDVVLERALPCRPCSLHGNTSCRHAGRCLADISPEEALEALQR